MVANGTRAPLTPWSQVPTITVMWASGEYTIDYVAARGCKRVCFESKPSWENATDGDAIEKCRCLRDHSMCRVFIIAGHGSNLRFMDFGNPGEATETEVTLEQVHRAVMA